MTAWIDRLLGRLNRPFDKAPRRALALRLRAAGGLRWRLADDALTLRRPGQPDLVVPLAGLTIGTLGERLAAAGIEIAYANGELRDDGALALLWGEGDQDASDGDHLWLYTSLLWVWADAAGRALERARLDVVEALRQMRVTTAEGEWLDLWGSFFGVHRQAGESIGRFRDRVIRDWRRPRSNPVAIQANIAREFGVEVDVREPWREMFTLGRSRLSGGHHLPNAREFSYHHAQLRSRAFLDWAPIMRSAQGDRPAGTLLLPPVTLPPPFPLRAPPGAVGFGGLGSYGWWVKVRREGVLSGDLVLSGGERVRRHPSILTFEDHIFHAGPLGGFGDLASHRTQCVGELVLSAQGRLGSAQAHLPGRKRQRFGQPLRLGGRTRLSNYRFGSRWVPILRWLNQGEAFAAACDQPGTATPLYRGDSRWLALTVPFPDPAPPAIAATPCQALRLPPVFGGGWTGRWDRRHWSDGGYVLSTPGEMCGSAW